MLSKKNIFYLSKILILSLIFSSIFSFVFMDIYKKRKNHNLYEYNLILDHKLEQEFMKKYVNMQTGLSEEPIVQKIILTRLYNSFTKAIVSQDKGSFLTRSGIAQRVNYQNILKIPMNYHFKKSDIITFYENSRFDTRACNRSRMKDYYKIFYKNEEIYLKCNHKSYLLKRFDDEKKYITFINNVKINKINNNTNKDSYFYKFIFFFILFSFILFCFEINKKKKLSN